MSPCTGHAVHERGTDSVELIPAVENLLDRHWPFCRDRLCDSATFEHDARSVPLSALQTTDGFAEQLRVFASGYPGEDRRALASLWLQWYVATIWPPLVAAVLLLRAEPELGGEHVALMLDEEAKPVALALPATAAAGDPGRGLERLVQDQAAPLFEAAAAASGMAPRVAWSNAANVLGWFVDELTAIADPATLAPAYDLLTQPNRTDGARNPLHVPGPASQSARRPRRVCCLRYCLTGFEYCTDCPITSRRGSS